MTIIVTCTQANGARIIKAFTHMGKAEDYCAVQRAKGWRCGITGKAREPKATQEHGQNDRA